MNLKTANAVIRRAREEKRNADKHAHAFQPSYNQPLGYHVESVFMAVTGDAFRLPLFNSELGRYILARSNAEQRQARDALGEVDPEDAKAIRALQFDLQVAAGVQNWLADLVTEGRNAEDTLTALDQKH